MYALFYLTWVMITLILFLIFQVVVDYLTHRGNILRGKPIEQIKPETAISAEMAPLPCIVQRIRSGM